MVEPDGLPDRSRASRRARHVALHGWDDPVLASDLRRAVAAIERDGGLVRVDETLAAATAERAVLYGLSAYVVAAERRDMRLASCDLRDLVRPGLAVMPTQALGSD